MSHTPPAIPRGHSWKSGKFTARGNCCRRSEPGVSKSNCFMGLGLLLGREKPFFEGGEPGTTKTNEFIRIAGETLIGKCRAKSWVCSVG